jgi:acetyl-CoA carboxylase biotin carboxyl carrier protein
MDLETLREIIALMKEHDLAEIDLEEEGRRMKVVATRETPAPTFYPMPSMGGAPAGPAQGGSAASGSPTSATPEMEELGETINSPIVGTFYRAPSPESPSYINEGDDFDDETVLCIVEAMKVMNEIKAEAKGRLVEVLVENGQPVEFGQPLFRISTAE